MGNFCKSIPFTYEQEIDIVCEQCISQNEQNSTNVELLKTINFVNSKGKVKCVKHYYKCYKNHTYYCNFLPENSENEKEEYDEEEYDEEEYDEEEYDEGEYDKKQSKHIQKNIVIATKVNL
jgi:hypothetical protein